MEDSRIVGVAHSDVGDGESRDCSRHPFGTDDDGKRLLRLDFGRVVIAAANSTVDTRAVEDAVDGKRPNQRGRDRIRPWKNDTNCSDVLPLVDVEAD